MLQEQLQLGAHAIASGEDHRLLVFAEVIACGEEAKRIGQLPLLLRAFHEGADVIDEGCRLMNIDAGLLVSVLGHREREGFYQERGAGKKKLIYASVAIGMVSPASASANHHRKQGPFCPTKNGIKVKEERNFAKRACLN